MQNTAVKMIYIIGGSVMQSYITRIAKNFQLNYK